jgi:hypothetical protein
MICRTVFLWRPQFAVEEIPDILSLHRITAIDAHVLGLGGSPAGQTHHLRAVRTKI